MAISWEFDYIKLCMKKGISATIIKYMYKLIQIITGV